MNSKIKLGIIVVYLVRPENGPLLNLHFEMIEKFTDIDYRIYASVNRLLPKFRHTLDKQSKVKICKVKTTRLRGGEENAYYTHELLNFALADGCTHIIFLHVDAFPIRDEWFKDICSNLSEKCPVAAIEMTENNDNKPHSSFIIFLSDFYKKFQPNLLISNEEMKSELYIKYKEIYPHVCDSGFGFGFTLFKEGLEWLKLHKSNKVEDHFNFGSIYGDAIFHLSNATRIKLTVKDLNNFYNSGNGSIKSEVSNLIGSLLPKGLITQFKSKLAGIVFRKQLMVNKKIFDKIREQLLENPEKYINYLRNGNLDKI